MRQTAAALVVTVACLVLFVDSVSDFFIYHRGGILAGEYWRFISGHFVHGTTEHLLLNLAAWLLVWVYGLPVCSNSTWTSLLLACALGSGAGLFWLSPEVEWYTGLSGVLHGLFAAVSILHLLESRRDYAAWFILVVVSVKLGYEYFQGPTPITSDWVGLRVIFEAHWYGALSGVLAVFFIGLLRKRRRAPTVDS